MLLRQEISVPAYFIYLRISYTLTECIGQRSISVLTHHLLPTIHLIQNKMYRMLYFLQEKYKIIFPSLLTANVPNHITSTRKMVYNTREAFSREQMQFYANVTLLIQTKSYIFSVLNFQTRIESRHTQRQ